MRTPALSDPTRVRVLLPAGYRSDATRRYPVLYLLHGANSDDTSWTRFGDAERITARAPMIVVMPDGGAQGWYTDWYAGDRTVQPRWEAYHVGELVPWIDATYRTVAAKRGRAIAGLSMGGYGALSYAARHPDTFAAAASFSGALEIGSEDAWGVRSANEARWRAHLPISIASRLRSLALVEIRTGDGRPGPLHRPATQPGCPACSLERFLHPANVRLHRRLRRSGSATSGTTTARARTTGPTGAVTSARRCPGWSACSPAAESAAHRPCPATSARARETPSSAERPRDACAAWRRTAQPEVLDRLGLGRRPGSRGRRR